MRFNRGDGLKAVRKDLIVGFFVLPFGIGILLNAKNIFGIVVGLAITIAEGNLIYGSVLDVIFFDIVCEQVTLVSIEDTSSIKKLDFTPIEVSIKQGTKIKILETRKLYDIRNRDRGSMIEVIYLKRSRILLYARPIKLK